jgi:hypothetical protein
MGLRGAVKIDLLIASAASESVAPFETASTTRARKSFEYGFAIHAGPMPQREAWIVFAGTCESPNGPFSDSTFSENALEIVSRAFTNLPKPL